MITFLLLLILLLGEVLFALLNVWKQTYHYREKMFYRFGIAGILLLLMLVGILEGMIRYGMLIALLLIQGIVLLIQNRRKETAEGKMTDSVKVTGQLGRVMGAMILFTFSLAVAILLPQYEPLPVTGEHEVETVMYTWVDEDRVETYTDTGEKRAVSLKIWYPHDSGSYPLIVFSHGAGGMLESNASTCMELASNGYVAVSIAHSYQAAYVEDVHGKVTMLDMEFMSQIMMDNGSTDLEHEEKVYELQKEWMEIRTRDENFVLDTILDYVKSGEGVPFDRINIEKIGLFGHSLGGATSVAVGRQRTDIDAVIDLEGTMLGEYIGYEKGVVLYCEDPYPIPLLDINSRNVYEQIQSQELAGAQQYVNFFVGERADHFQEMIMEEAGHMNFCDLAVISPLGAKLLGTGTTDAREFLVQLNAIVLNYFNNYLKEA